MKKFVYSFGDGTADGDGKMKEVLGGKGAGLAEMCRAKLPVPPGFTISTEVCNIYFQNGNQLPKDIHEQMLEALGILEERMGQKLGDRKNPLLVSVRSGAKFSMPGMMDTILNLGLNDRTVEALENKSGNPRFAQDCYRRFIQMFGNVVLNIEKHEFDRIFEGRKKKVKAALDTDLTAEDLRAVIVDYKKLAEKRTGAAFPQDSMQQLAMARDAVFRSWNNARANHYRKMNNIPDDLGTAVNVQAMVFGNLGDTSATGVGFTRNPSTGEPQFYGEFLINAQGEDVVAGIRTPQPIFELRNWMPEVYDQLREITSMLEKHYRDVQDFEFTVQEGKLYMLQTRVGKRTGIAAVKIAVDMVKEGLISKQEAVQRIGPDQLAQYLYPIFDTKEESKVNPLGKGLPAGPGAAAGKIALTPDRAVDMKAAGQRVVLVRQETSPDDIHGMNAAAGFLTARGGMTSHAAVVARQMGKVCVAGCEAVEVLDSQTVKIGAKAFREGDYLSINGSTGNVYEGDIPVVESEIIQVIQGKLEPKKSDKYQRFATILSWADSIRTLRVRANADVPEQAKIACGFGAEGIGLCRTEHMFFAEDRIPVMQKMILARTKEEREKHLDQLLPLQKQDFLGLYHEMQGYPVTIRLLDPPLHEFLPKREELMVEIAQLELTGRDGAKLQEQRQLLARVEELHEFNPMLGLRGCRLGITMPEITRMQARAIMEAACELAKEGKKIVPEIMIPLVGMVSEMKSQKDLVREVAQETMKQYDVKLSYLVGTMIELPRAAVTADRIATEAEFFSFGTNDLTQTTFGFSRDDAAKFIDHYKTVNIMGSDPFAVLDREGVGALMKQAVVGGRKTRPGIKLGICGEHGGDPNSIQFCHQLGLDYVSCSPYRVSIARLAAAHAALAEADAKKAVIPSSPSRAKSTKSARIGRSRSRVARKKR